MKAPQSFNEPIVFDAIQTDKIKLSSDTPNQVLQWKEATTRSETLSIIWSERESPVGGYVYTDMLYGATPLPYVRIRTIWWMPHMDVASFGIAYTFTAMPDPLVNSQFTGLTVIFDSVDGTNYPVIDAYVDYIEQRIYIRYAWKSGGMDDVKWYSTTDDYGAYDILGEFEVPTRDAANNDLYTFGVTSFGDRVCATMYVPVGTKRKCFSFECNITKNPADTSPRIGGNILPYSWGSCVHEMRILPCVSDEMAWYDELSQMDAKWAIKKPL